MIDAKPIVRAIERRLILRKGGYPEKFLHQFLEKITFQTKAKAMKVSY
jgi:hypothetical protein